MSMQISNKPTISNTNCFIAKADTANVCKSFYFFIFNDPALKGLVKKQPNDKSVATDPTGPVEQCHLAMDVVSE